MPGIEIYLPLSSTLTLALLCPTYNEKVRAHHTEAKKSLQHFQAYEVLGQNVNRANLTEGLALAEKAILNAETFLSAVERGTPIECEQENVTRLNSHQVKFSHRYVMSLNEDFSLVERMISDNEKFRHGLMPKID